MFITGAGYASQHRSQFTFFSVLCSRRARKGAAIVLGATFAIAQRQDPSNTGRIQAVRPATQEI